MKYSDYLEDFKKAAAQLDKKLIEKKEIIVEVGTWLESVVLRMIKKSWANDPTAKPQSGAAIFFSIWLNEKSLKEKRVYYNIHALKLRQLHGYKITSREFASKFRARFKRFEKDWPNVDVSFGPLTLMQGWEVINDEQLQETVTNLAGKFLELDGLIDELLGG